jgi:hypothetical protein
VLVVRHTTIIAPYHPYANSLQKWNPQIHLNLTTPKQVVLYEPTFPSHPVPPPKYPRGSRSTLAYTEPFQLLSPKGIEDLRKVVDYNLKHAVDGTTQKDTRIPLCLRGMGYRSQFIRDMNTCPVTLKFLSDIAGTKLVPSDYETSWGHTNIGVIGRDLAVDQWHIDSVPFVLVILLSDMSNAKGGDLQVIKKSPYQAAFQRIAQTQNNIPEEEVLTVNYPSQGCAIFMQGSHMVHHVTPVEYAKERRITVVNSYQAADPRYPDDTRLGVFKNEPETCFYEFARHRAIRARARLDEFLQQPKWVSDPLENAKELRHVANELSEAVDILTLVKDDAVQFYRENEEKATGGGMMPASAPNSKSSKL